MLIYGVIKDKEKRMFVLHKLKKKKKKGQCSL